MQYGLIGRKLSHSFSAEIHSKLADYNYELYPIEPEKLDDFFAKKDFKAINVTIPYKEAVIPYLYYIDPLAKKIGAVNTIINKNGKLFGYNTDFFGMTQMIKRSGIDVKGKTAAVLGSGGTCKTALTVLSELGAKKCYIVSRTADNNRISYQDLYKVADNIDIILNTTPCGMFPDSEKSAVETDKFKNLSGVIDVIYNPLKTKLTSDAQKSNIKNINGLYMLVAQAALASSLFTDDESVLLKCDKVYSEILKEKTNIVLIGMPGCGKTTIGKNLAKKLNRKFTDSDEEFIKRKKMSISDYFNKYSEKEFRDAETEIISEICKNQSQIIATGGGIVTKRQNIDYLKKNGLIIFLDKDIKLLQIGNGRPLTSNADALKKKYNERYPLYNDYCDLKINISNDLNENTDLILKSLSEMIL